MFDLNKQKELAQQLETVVNNVRKRRQPLLEKWINIHEAWKNNVKEQFFSSSTFNHQIPYFRRQVEKFAVRGAQMVLPTSDYFEVFPTDEDDEQSGKAAEATLMYMYYIFRKKIRTYSVVKQLFRTYVLYQRAIAKTGVKVVREDGEQRVWPTLRAVDPFLWFYWPETAASLEEAQIVVEDSFIPLDQYELEVENGRALKLDPKKIMAPTWPDDIVRRLSTEFFTPPESETVVSTEEKKHKAIGEWIFRSEVWVRSNQGWRSIWIVWNYEGGPIVTRVSKTTYPRPSYRVALAREIPTEQYTSSIGDDLYKLQVLLNDQINMFLEAQAIQIAGPTAVDNTLVQRKSSLVYKHRAVWLVPPEGVRPIATHSSDISKSALTGMSSVMGLMDNFGGSNPMAEGQPIRNMPRAGFAVSSMMTMALADTKDVARAIEEEILSPVLGDIYNLTMEFIPKRQLIKIPRTQQMIGRKMTKKDLHGDFEFNWVGSLQMQDYQMRATRLLELMKQLGPLSQTIAQDLQAKGKQINWMTILKRLWRYGLGEQGADSVIEDIPQGQSMNPTAAAALLEQLGTTDMPGSTGGQITGQGAAGLASLFSGGDEGDE